MEWLPRRRWSLLPKVLHSFLSSSRLLELFHQIIPTHSILKLSTRQTNKHKDQNSFWRTKVIQLYTIVRLHGLEVKAFFLVPCLDACSVRPNLICCHYWCRETPLFYILSLFSSCFLVSVFLSCLAARCGEGFNQLIKRTTLPFLAKQQHQLGNILISESGPLRELFTLRFITIHE